jgi:hypothetical protein
VIKKLEAQVVQFPSGLQVTGDSWHFSERTRTLGELPAASFVQNVLQFPQQRLVILRVDSLFFGR